MYPPPHILKSLLYLLKRSLFRFLYSLFIGLMYPPPHLAHVSSSSFQVSLYASL